MHELLGAVAVPNLMGEATSPTTSTASAFAVPSNNLACNAVLAANSCNTLPHSNGSSNGISLSNITNNIALNRNIVMLRNHLRKNTSSAVNAVSNVVAAAIANATQHEDKDQ